VLNNDLDNRPNPTMYVVWEGLIAVCCDMKQFHKLMKQRRYGKALELFEPQPLTIAAMWKAMHDGLPWSFSVVTHLPKPLLDGVLDSLAAENVPYQSFLAVSPGELRHRLPYMPWVIGVADPESGRARSYGSFGCFVPPESAGSLRGIA